MTDDKEVFAEWMIKHGYATGHGDTMEDLLEELEWQIVERSQRAVEVEREACAKLVYEITSYRGIADAIRARGNTLTKLNKAAEDNGEEL